MRTGGAVALLIGVMAIVSACSDTTPRSAGELAALGKTRQRQLISRLAKVDKGEDKSKPVALWIMPAELREISGLALTADGRILAHDDESLR